MVLNGAEGLLLRVPVVHICDQVLLLICSGIRLCHTGRLRWSIPTVGKSSQRNQTFGLGNENEIYMACLFGLSTANLRVMPNDWYFFYQ